MQFNVGIVVLRLYCLKPVRKVAFEEILWLKKCDMAHLKAAFEGEMIITGPLSIKRKKGGSSEVYSCKI